MKPELVDIQYVYTLTGFSPRTIERFASDGRMPFGIKIGRMRRWRRAELESWIAGGCRPVRRQEGASDEG